MFQWRLLFKMRVQLFLGIYLGIILISSNGYAQNDIPVNDSSLLVKSGDTIFDDRMLLRGYAKKYKNLSKEILLEMIKDETLNSYKVAAAVRVFNEKFSLEVVSKEKKRVDKILRRTLHKTDSPFVQVEIMYTLCKMDRYHYFKSMVPALIQKLDHYNETVNLLAFESLNNLLKNENARAREARLVFNTLRKVLFLSRKRLAKVETPSLKLTQKLQLLRWSIKILGTQELKKLPREVLDLL